MSATAEARMTNRCRYFAGYVMEDKRPTDEYHWMARFWEYPTFGMLSISWNPSDDWEADCRATIGEVQRQAHFYIEQLEREGYRNPMPLKEDFIFDMNAPDYKRELARAFLKLGFLIGDGCELIVEKAAKYGIDLGVKA